jgi:uracil phosphoribosyltransferase
MVRELDSALVTHLVNTLRRSDTDAVAFRRIVRQLTLLLADAALGPERLRSEHFDTWQGERAFERFDESRMLVVTVLRAGLPMLEAMTEYFPGASAGFLAIKRNEETHEATLYYDRVPDCSGRHVILVDPMVATGGSLDDAMNVLEGRGAASITSLNIIGAPEGLAHVEKRWPDLDLYIAQIDERLNGDKYIIPGLGDAGDRAYNTPE